MMTNSFDVIVVGAGMAGSLAAAVAIEAGASTALIDVGPNARGEALGDADLQAPLSKKSRAKTRWPYDLYFSLNGQAGRRIDAVQGYGSGGSATLYGACLNRFRRSDFELDDGVTTGNKRLSNNWPIPFDEIVPHYAELEKSLGVAGESDPLDPDDAQSLIPPAATRPSLSRLMDEMRGEGLHPYRLHFAAKRVRDCIECQGVPCARECKSDTYNRILAPFLRAKNFTSVFFAQVSRLRRKNGDYLVNVTDALGRVTVLRARKVILAAGAIQTPLILQRSADLWPSVPETIGRGLMFHSSETIAVQGDADMAEPGALKALAVRDFYRFDDGPGGEIQSLGIIPSTGILNTYLRQEAQRMGFEWLGPFLHGLRIPAYVAARGFRNSILLTTVVEDLPYWRNRVTNAPGTLGARIEYHVSDELRQRCRTLRRKLRESLPSRRVTFLSPLANINLGHGSGSCRMGTDPATSVLQPDGQVWGLPGLYVVDASAFPSSGAANPALTVAANARRIMHGVIQDMGAKVDARSFERV